MSYKKIESAKNEEIKKESKFFQSLPIIKKKSQNIHFLRNIKNFSIFF